MSQIRAVDEATENVGDKADAAKVVSYLLSTRAIRERSKKILALLESGQGEFTLDRALLPEVADFVTGIIKQRFPKLDIPYHARSGHFRVGHIDRVAQLNAKLQDETPEERARIMFDLIITSVLLDAGAGADWKYNEDGHLYSRSEGLAVASFNMFMAAAFSSDLSVPLRADGRGLLHLTEERLKQDFQVSVGNPLVGTKGRVELLQRLGKVIEEDKEYFRGPKVSRPGHLVDYFLKKYPKKVLKAEDVLQAILHGLGKIWPGRVILNDINLGDCWRHPKLGDGAHAFVPIHKLSQWLTYSLLEPLEELGFQIQDIDGLTGLAEYRNGGLFVDMGVLQPKFDVKKAYHVDSKVVVEWRSATVGLLDELAVLIRERLGKTKEQMPLAKILEGGTWWAGRKLAQEKRGGRPPVEILSDGTVF